MSVYIKGMKMPTSCDKCEFTVWDDFNCDVVCPFCGIVTLETGKRADCPIIEVHEHGRLIDEDIVEKKIQFIMEAEAHIYGRASWNFAGKILNAVYEAPTVIQASEVYDG